MPTVKPNESRKDFVSRCIPVVLNDGTAKDASQASAICYSIFSEHKKKMKKSIAAAATGPRLARCPQCGGFNVTRKKGEAGHGSTDHCRDCNYAWPVVPGTLPAAQLAMSAEPLILDGGGLSAGKDVPLALTGLPAEIDGQKCHYRKKEIARVGHYVHRGQKNPDGTWMEFDLTPERLDGWIAAFNKRLAAGVKPFVPERHVANLSDARANMGYVIDLKRDGDSLYATMQLIGDDALAVAARNDVSIYTQPHATDANGAEYEEVLEHVCLTSNPAIPNLQPFEQIAASADRPAIAARIYTLAAAIPEDNPMTPELLKQFRDKYGIAASVPDDQIPDLAAKQSLALSVEVTALKAEKETLKAGLKEKEDKVLQLSADAPRKPDALTLGMFADNINAKRQQAIASGAITEAEAKSLFDPLLNDASNSPNSLALSASAGGKPLGFVLWDALAKLSGDAMRTGRAPRPGTRTAQQLAASADKKDEADPDEVAAMRRHAGLPPAAAK